MIGGIYNGWRVRVCKVTCDWLIGWWWLLAVNTCCLLVLRLILKKIKRQLSDLYTGIKLWILKKIKVNKQFRITKTYHIRSFNSYSDSVLTISFIFKSKIRCLNLASCKNVALHSIFFGGGGCGYNWIGLHYF